ncbi:MAG TPA: ATP-grasp domain-containing protein, partial [Ktedonobacterales bacterium]|nr:ATP-grasp domain-containing protein [Ktedonobacterales bacterium]
MADMAESVEIAVGEQPATGRKRLLLLMTPATYRAGAYLDAAKNLDVEIIRGLDLPKALADEWGVQMGLDFADIGSSVATLQEAHARQPFDAIVPVDDSATILAARANAALGLPWNPPEAVEAARDKGVMRRLMAEAGVPSPVFRRFALTTDPHEIARQVTYPCVVKPLRLSGSRGVIRANTPDELVAAVARLERILLDDGNIRESTDILVEDFIPGVEVALDGLLREDGLHVLAIFDKPDPLDGPFFEETIYTTPSRLPSETQTAIAECAARAAAAIGLRDGPIHAELRVNGRGPWMVEIAGRSIGGLCSTILEFGAGMCLEELLLRHALRMELPSLERAGSGSGVMMIPIPKGGVLRAVHGVEEAAAVPDVTGVEITIRPHTLVVPLPEGNSYLGFIFARSESPAAAEQALRLAHSKLRFDIAPLLAMAR